MIITIIIIIIPLASFVKQFHNKLAIFTKSCDFVGLFCLFPISSCSWIQMCVHFLHLWCDIHCCIQSIVFSLFSGVVLGRCAIHCLPCSWRQSAFHARRPRLSSRNVSQPWRPQRVRHWRWPLAPDWVCSTKWLSWKNPGLPRNWLRLEIGKRGGSASSQVKKTFHHWLETW